MNSPVRQTVSSNRTHLAAHINDNHRALWAKDAYQAAARARALLAQPEPPELTDEKLLSLVAEVFGYVFLDGGIGGGESEFLAYARAAIAADRARRPTPQPPADGELTVNLRMDLSSECLKRLCDGLAAAVIPNGGYRELTTDDDISGEFIGEQTVGVTWWLPEHGCDSLENTLDAIKGRLCAAVRDWLPTAVTATPQPEPAPVAVSERPWERDDWCDALGKVFRMGQ
jgi:hypothetical protein